MDISILRKCTKRRIIQGNHKDLEAFETFLVAVALGAMPSPWGWESGPGFVARRQIFRLSFHFGLFQFLMPLVGWYLGQNMVGMMRQWAPWMAFALLFFIGAKMGYENLKPHEAEDREACIDPTKGFSLVMLSVATSIDALGVGFGLGIMGQSLFFSALCIGIVACLMTWMAMKLGNRLSEKFGTANGNRRGTNSHGDCSEVPVRLKWIQHMVARLEITLKSHLFDAEGASLCRKIRTISAGKSGQARVINVLTLDTDLSETELEAVRTEIFTNPVTQVSSFQPWAADFDWAIWVGYRPGVRDTAGSVAIEAIADYLGQSSWSPMRPPTPPGCTCLQDAPLDRKQVETIARELLANDIIQQWRVYSRSEWDDEGIGLIVPKVVLAHTPSVAEIPIPSDEDSHASERGTQSGAQPPGRSRSSGTTSCGPRCSTRAANVGLSAAHRRGAGIHLPGPERSLQPQHLSGHIPVPRPATGRSSRDRQPLQNLYRGPTLQIQKEKDWVVSVLWDNAGVARFDEDHNYVDHGRDPQQPVQHGGLRRGPDRDRGRLPGPHGHGQGLPPHGRALRLLCRPAGLRRTASRPTCIPGGCWTGSSKGCGTAGTRTAFPPPSADLFFHPVLSREMPGLCGRRSVSCRAEINGEPTDQKRPKPET